MVDGDPGIINTLRKVARTYGFRFLNAGLGIAFACAFGAFLCADRFPERAGLRPAMLLDPFLAAAVVMGLLALSFAARPRPLFLAAAAHLGAGLAGYHFIGAVMLAMSIRPWSGVIRMTVCLAAIAWACWLLVAALRGRRRASGG